MGGEWVAVVVLVLIREVVVVEEGIMEVVVDIYTSKF